MSDKMPEGSLLKVTIEVRLPAAATEDEVDAWLRFDFRDNGSIDSDNPLLHFSAEPWGSFGSFEWEPTGEIGRREEYDSVPTDGGGRRYKVRYHRDHV